MPCYLVHGFRWPRRAIRIHIILEDLDEAAAEYLTAPGTSTTMLANFRHKWPAEMDLLPELRFVEQYDPNDTSSRALSQPYAFVVDKVKVWRLSCNVMEAMEELVSGVVGAGAKEGGNGIENVMSGNGEGRGRGRQRSHSVQAEEEYTAMTRLKDQLAPEEKLGWWVVYNGDEGRLAGMNDEEETACVEGRNERAAMAMNGNGTTREEACNRKSGLRKLFKKS